MHFLILCNSRFKAKTVERGNAYRVPFMRGEGGGRQIAFIGCSADKLFILQRQRAYESIIELKKVNIK